MRRRRTKGRKKGEGQKEEKKEGLVRVGQRWRQSWEGGGQSGEAELAPTCFRHNRHRRCCLHIYWGTVSRGALFLDSFFLPFS